MVMALRLSRLGARRIRSNSTGRSRGVYKTADRRLYARSGDLLVRQVNSALLLTPRRPDPEIDISSRHLCGVAVDHMFSEIVLSLGARLTCGHCARFFLPAQIRDREDEIAGMVLIPTKGEEGVAPS